jgi:hypothetical protein
MGVVKSEAMVVVDIVKMSMVWVVVVMVVEEDESIDFAFVAVVVANDENSVADSVVFVVVVGMLFGECDALGTEIDFVEAVQNDLTAVVQVQAVVVVDNSTVIQPADDVVSVEE